MAEVLLEISFYWKEEKTECQPCYLCNDIIYSDAYRLIFNIGEKVNETNIVLCNSCFNAIQE